MIINPFLLIVFSFFSGTLLKVECRRVVNASIYKGLVLAVEKDAEGEVDTSNRIQFGVFMHKLKTTMQNNGFVCRETCSVLKS